MTMVDLGRIECSNLTRISLISVTSTVNTFQLFAFASLTPIAVELIFIRVHLAFWYLSAITVINTVRILHTVREHGDSPSYFLYMRFRKIVGGIGGKYHPVIHGTVPVPP